MKRRWLKTNLHPTVVSAALAVIAAHLVLSALFYMEAPLPERLVWAAVTIGVLGAAAHNFAGLSRPLRGLVCVAVGLPATLFGLGVHASHVVQVGFATSDLTGIPMLIAGLVLTLSGAVTLVRLVYTWWRRLLLLPLAPVLAFFVIFPAGMGVFAANVAKVPCCDTTPADYGFAYEDVTFQTDRGLDLFAWYIPTQNGAVVITVHGAGNNRSTVMDEALTIARHGYGVLMVDLEGFGDSQGRGNMMGWIGARSVHAAVDYLRSRPDVDPERIGAYGRSMGGEVLLQAAGESTHLKAVVSEGGTGRTAADFAELDDGWFEAIVPFQTVMGTAMHLVSAEPVPPPLKQMVEQIAPRRVLLIAATVREETDLMGQYLQFGGPSFELWTIPEPKHVGAFDLHPEEFEARVIAFFDDALLGDVAGPAAAR